ncbi:MAG: type II toxin-antitoxin system VapC family toxin [Thermosynechococcaceae cyanobacterium]
MFLLEMNTISELRKLETTRIDTNVKEWAKTTKVAQTYLSAITIFELERGVLLIERRDPVQGSLLRQWLDGHVLGTYAARIIPISVKVAQRCALLNVPDAKPYYDGLLAATALIHGLTIVTRNTRDFENTGVKLLNPWQYC